MIIEACNSGYGLGDYGGEAGPYEYLGIYGTNDERAKSVVMCEEGDSLCSPHSSSYSGLFH